GNPIGRCENGNSCTPAGGICRLQTVSCSANANCCSGNVLNHDTCKQDNLGIPRCLAAEVDCTDPANYVGKACASSADCCNLPCVKNPNGDVPPYVCAAECVPSGGSCSNTADCCSGVACILAPGSTAGTCAYRQPPPPGGTPNPDGGGTTTPDGGNPPPPPNPPNCADYGQGCNTTADCCNGVPCTGGFCKIVIR
ncbi:MAG TPA: hypothetical protein VL137_10990, partial [Polyangiaceae bacterium]|nr:hypothetical protein [Polyangiaceae bacterium]